MFRGLAYVCTLVVMLSSTVGCIFAVDHELDDDNQHNDPTNDPNGPPTAEVSIDGPDHRIVDPDDFVLTYETDCQPEDCHQNLWCRIRPDGDEDSDELFDDCSDDFTVDETDVGQGEWVAEVQLRRGQEDDWIEDQTSTTVEYLSASIPELEPDDNIYHHPHLGTFSAECSASDCRVDCQWAEADSGTPEPECDLEEPFELNLSVDPPASATLNFEACTEQQEPEACISEIYDFQYRTPTWQAVEGGWHHTCALLEDDTLWCWGDNEYGMAAPDDASDDKIFEPHRIAAHSRWLDVGAARYQTCGIEATTRNLVCWGRNLGGVIDAQDPVGAVFEPRTADDKRQWRRVEGSARHLCGLTDDDRLFCWGNSDDHRLGGQPDDEDPFVHVEAPGETTWVDVDPGGFHTCAIAEDEDGLGQLYCWGANDDGQLGLGDDDGSDPVDSPSPVEFEDDQAVHAVSTGENFSCAVADHDPDPHVHCWGDNVFGQVGIDNNNDDTFWSPQPVYQTDVGYLDRLAAGRLHACGLNTDYDDAFCWGNAIHQAVGHDPGIGTAFKPGAVETTDGTDGDDFESISAGRAHNCARTQSGELKCWGLADYGQLGIGEPDEETDYYAPRLVVWPYAHLAE